MCILYIFCKLTISVNLVIFHELFDMFYQHFHKYIIVSINVFYDCVCVSFKKKNL